MDVITSCEITALLHAWCRGEEGARNRSVEIIWNEIVNLFRFAWLDRTGEGVAESLPAHPIAAFYGAGPLRGHGGLQNQIIAMNSAWDSIDCQIRK
jgi:hypothetical protein